MNKLNEMNELTRGIVIFVALAVLTAIEYFAGINEASIIVMAVLAIVKAGLVLWYFMHLGRVLNPGEGGH